MTPPPAISLARWNGRLADLREEYRQNQPFPHVRLTDFLEPGVAEALERVFPAPDPNAWTHYGHYNVQGKFGNAQRASYPPDIRRVIDELNAPGFLVWLSAADDAPVDLEVRWPSGARSTAPAVRPGRAVTLEEPAVP